MGLIGHEFKIGQNAYKITGFKSGETLKPQYSGAQPYGMRKPRAISVPTFRVVACQTLPTGDKFGRVLAIEDVLRFANLSPLQEAELKRLQNQFIEG